MPGVRHATPNALGLRRTVLWYSRLMPQSWLSHMFGSRRIRRSTLGLRRSVLARGACAEAWHTRLAPQCAWARPACATMCLGITLHTRTQSCGAHGVQPHAGWPARIAGVTRPFRFTPKGSAGNGGEGPQRAQAREPHKATKAGWSTHAAGVTRPPRRAEPGTGAKARGSCTDVGAAKAEVHATSLGGPSHPDHGTTIASAAFRMHALHTCNAWVHCAHHPPKYRWCYALPTGWPPLYRPAGRDVGPATRGPDIRTNCGMRDQLGASLDPRPWLGPGPPPCLRQGRAAGQASGQMA